MCVVSEELSRGYIGVGSLGTRSEIAAELILDGGTEEQKQRMAAEDRVRRDPADGGVHRAEHRLGPRLAQHPRRAQDGDVYKRHRQEDLDHPPGPRRPDDLLVRTNPDEQGYKGLSMLLAEKPRGTDDDPFPAKGMTGGEIEVLGYRGMKEYDISFDGFEVPAANLLGGVEGQGFKQLMQTFEAARIQTAARAIGVAQSALDLGLRYAQGAHPVRQADLIAFPRVADKLAMMAVEIHARPPAHLFRRAARRTTAGAAISRPAWPSCSPRASPGPPPTTRCRSTAATASRSNTRSAACCATPASSSIFEGAAEIQAQVIARRLLEMQ